MFKKNNALLEGWLAPVKEYLLLGQVSELYGGISVLQLTVLFGNIRAR